MFVCVIIRKNETVSDVSSHETANGLLKGYLATVFRSHLADFLCLIVVAYLTCYLHKTEFPSLLLLFWTPICFRIVQ